MRKTIKQLMAVFVVICAFTIISVSIQSHAQQRIQLESSTGPLFSLSFIKGIDTIVVTTSTGPDSDLLPLKMATPTQKGSEPVVDAVKKLFSKHKHLSIRSRHEMQINELKQPNVIVFNFVLSQRIDKTNGNDAKVGAVSLQIKKYVHNDEGYAVPVLPVTYPFLIPSDPKAFGLTIAQGVEFLAAHLPSYFDCLNNRPDACSKLVLPYGESAASEFLLHKRKGP